MLRSMGFIMLMTVVLVLCKTSYAGDDKADANITAADWTGVSSSAFDSWAVSATTNKPIVSQSRKYLADATLIAAHAHLKNNGNALNHEHYRDEWGAGGCPTAAEADTYWNKRFWGAAKLTAAVRKHQTCHEWALTQRAPGGVYNYVLTNGALNTVYGGDVTQQAKATVAAGDVLTYGDHTSYVAATRADGAGGNEPAALRWKWLDSGSYEYTTPNNGVNEFDTPMCHTTFETDVNVNNTIDNQGWSWDLDCRTNAVVWR